MRKWFGWAGNILKIDLSKEKIMKEPLTEELAHNFLGGSGFNIKALWDLIKPGTDPLGPENVLCFGLGPLTGTLMPASARYSVSTKSPETGIFGDANSGGYWGPELKFAGYDQIILTKKAEKPVYIWIDDDNVEFRDAAHFWKSTTYEAEEIIKEELGDQKIEVCSIGTAGANLVRYSSIINDLFRAAARCGVGAVMGSKNVKAIAVRGSKGVDVADREEFEKLASEDRKTLLENKFIKNVTGHLGTPWLTIGWGASTGFFDANNSQTIALPEDVEALTGDTFFENYTVQLKGCFNCPIHCARYYEVKTGKYGGVRGSTCEFETIWAVGPMCGIFSLPPILHANNLCNQYGLDTISTGTLIAFGMECFEKGLVTKRDTNGIELKFGNDDALIEMIHQIAHREGLGNILAEGGVIAPKIIKGAENLYPNTLGLSRAAYQCYGQPAAALGTITSTRGADHLRGYHYSAVASPDFCKGKWGDPDIADPETVHGKEISLVWMQHEYTLADCLERTKCGLNDWYIACPLPDKEGVGRAKLVKAGTGWNVIPRDLERIAERVWNLETAFNVREGVIRKFMRAPWKGVNIPVNKGFRKGVKVNEKAINELLDRYFKHRGWDVKTGIPTREKLEELGLKYVADEIERNVPYPEWSGPTPWNLDKYSIGGPTAPAPRPPATFLEQFDDKRGAST